MRWVRRQFKYRQDPIRALAIHPWLLEPTTLQSVIAVGEDRKTFADSECQIFKKAYSNNSTATQGGANP